MIKKLIEKLISPRVVKSKPSKFGKRVDIVLDGGWGGLEPSTVLDCSQGDDIIHVVREGAGPLDIL